MLKAFIRQSPKQVPCFQSLGTIVRNLKENFDHYFARYENNMCLIIATFLDPRHKNRFWDKENNAMNKFHFEGPNFESKKILKTLVNEYKKIQGDTQQNHAREDVNDPQPGTSSQSSATTPTISQDISSESGKGYAFDMQSCMAQWFPVKSQQPFQQASGTTPIIEVINAEVKLYLSLDAAAQDSDPCLWWRSKIDQLPMLSRITRKMLSAPPSSVESERTFSVGANTYSKKRARLRPENGEMLIGLSQNLKYLNFNLD